MRQSEGELERAGGRRRRGREEERERMERERQQGSEGARREKGVGGWGVPWLARGVVGLASEGLNREGMR